MEGISSLSMFTWNVNTPLVQVLPVAQGEHSAPRLPHSVLLVPATQAPAAEQQPLQVS